MVCVLSLESTVGQYLESRGPADSKLAAVERITAHCGEVAAGASGFVAPATPPKAPPGVVVVVVVVAPVAAGTEVEIRGLVKLPCFNGCAGEVRGFDPATGRYDVLLDSPAGDAGVRCVKVLVDNLHLRPAQPPTASKTRRGTRRNGRKGHRTTLTIDADAEAIVAEQAAPALAATGARSTAPVTAATPSAATPAVASPLTPTTPVCFVRSPLTIMPPTPMWEEDFSIWGFYSGARASQMPLKLCALI